MNNKRIELIKKSFLEKYGQDIIDKVDFEIGDLLWNDTFELKANKWTARKQLLERGFIEREKGEYDFVKYLEGDIRIHVVEKGFKSKLFYHLDNH